MRDKFRDECGVFGIFGHPDAANLTYLGLYALQHRGQESAGIASADGKRLFLSRAMGYVSDAFDEATLLSLKGPSAIGHVRYSTAGDSRLVNAQPILIDCAHGEISLCHNGNLVNAQELRDELVRRGSIFQTSSDTEVILHLYARSQAPMAEDAIIESISQVRGAFSIAMLTKDKLIAVRDPHGFRPLAIGELDGATIVCSETCALDLIGATHVRDVEPGEVLVIDSTGMRSYKPFADAPFEHCIFEHVYFARPDSNLADQNVYKVRVNMGRELARENPVDADIVVPIPDSGNCAALGYSLESGIPFEMAFVRNHYVGRSFLQPSQLIRDFNVRVKLNLITGLVKDKRVIVVDDSIVRGTTCKKRVNSLKEAGAKEVHVMVSCPPHKNPCVYGIDFPDRNKLMAANHSLDEICTYLNADSVNYLSQAGMVRATGKPEAAFCLACYDGMYPVEYDPHVDKHIMEHRRARTESLVSDDSQPKLL